MTGAIVIAAVQGGGRKRADRTALQLDLGSGHRRVIGGGLSPVAHPGTQGRLAHLFRDAGGALLEVDARGRRRVVLPRPAVEVPEAPATRTDLERLTGSYAGAGWAVRVDLREDGLHLAVTEGLPLPPARLVPTSPTRFRWEGTGLAPGLVVVFKGGGDKAAALTVVQPGKEEAVMMPRRPVSER